MSTVRRVGSWILGAGLLFASRSAFAEEPLPPLPSKAPVAGTETCSVDRFVGVSETEAAAVEEVVCGPIRSSSNAVGRYRLRVVKLGGKVVVTLVTIKADGTSTETKQLALTSIDEVTVAAPRFLEAAVEQKPIEATVDVNNVVGDEARKPKKKAGEIHFVLGVIGASAVGQGTGGGANMALTVGNDRWSFVGDGRIAAESITKPSTISGAAVSGGGASRTGGGQQEAGFVYVSLAGGARHHLSSQDIAPFVGAGLAIDYVTQKTEGTGGDSGKTGVAAYGELGLDLLRTHVVGGAIVIRCDAPAFAMEEAKRDSADATKVRRTSTYAPIVSAGIAMRF